MPRDTKITPPYAIVNDELFYQAEADETFHIFLKREPYLLDVPHYHESWEFALIEQGETEAQIADKQRKLSAGDICFADKFQIHSYSYHDRTLSGIVVVLGKSYTSGFTTKFENAVLPCFMTDKEKNETAAKILHEWLRIPESQKTYLMDCAYANLFLNALTEAYGLSPREKSNSNEKTIEFIDYINKNYDRPISLKSMAQHFGYSEGRCSLLFNSCLHMSFKQYLNKIRMQKAAELLAQGNLPVSEVMEKCGYNSSVTFYRQYRAFKQQNEPS